MVLWWKRRTRFQGELKLLAEADTLAFGGVGFAGTVLPETKAYRTLDEQLASHDELRPQLERLLDRASPAGRIYAAELLTHADPAAGQRAWRRLAGQRDGAAVKTFQGCVMGSTTVARYAADRLAA